jgi:tRNA 2-thiouridine synthesizing protein D
LRFTVVVNTAPHSGEAAKTALRFCETLLGDGHELVRLFLYGDGTFNAASLPVYGQDEQNLPDAWQALVEAHELDAVVCVASAIKRGLLNDSESARHQKAAVSLADFAEVAGLGQLVDSVSSGDRCVVFG